MYMGICLTVILTVAAYSVFVSVPASVVFFFAFACFHTCHLPLSG